VAAVLLLAACSGGAAAPSTTADASRLSSENQAALDALVAVSPGTIDPMHAMHAGGHETWGPIEEVAVDAATTAALEAQWATAVDAAASFATPEDAAAAGYQKAAAEAPGVGAHYVRWDLVDAPFDPARPSMLLFDESTQRPTRLAGFSYWLRSVDGPPEGFAGPNDQWHMHLGMCFSNGFLIAEGVTEAAACTGDWLAGTDLWMMHAWVAPSMENPWGRFAPRNPMVCPSPGEQVSDALRCPES
jgi:hypothetical protein